MGHKKPSRGVAFLGSVGRGVKPKVVRKLLVEKPLFGMGQKKPKLHKIVWDFSLQKTADIFFLFLMG